MSLNKLETNHESELPNEKIHFYLGRNMLAELIKYLTEKQTHHIVLVSDKNEFRVLGEHVERALSEANFDVKTIVLEGDEIVPNEKYIVQTLLASNNTEQLFIAVGSGTVTDIVRFVSYYAKSFFISLPTAASVDGFASSSSALVIMDYKQSIILRPPQAIFADLETLCNAPRSLIAAGFGDMFGKFTALADWKLANILVGDKYDDNIAKRSSLARDKVVAQAKILDIDWENGVKSVMEALYEEGLCMLEFGNSRPASGSEHQFSHYWEMKLLREGRPAILHGAKVGLASIWTARYYELIRKMSKEDVIHRLETTPQLDPEIEKQKILQGYGENIADFIVKTQVSYLHMPSEKFESLKTKIINNWDAIQEIASQVPSPDEISALIQKVGGGTTPEEIGLTITDIKDALEYSHYVRTTFTILNVCRMLGLKLTV